MGNTTVDLVKDLEEKLNSEFFSDTKIRNSIKTVITRAKMGYYHDFASPDATPKMNLRRILLILNLGDLAQKVINGEYDDESPSDKLPLDNH